MQNIQQNKASGRLLKHRYLCSVNGDGTIWSIKPFKFICQRWRNARLGNSIKVPFLHQTGQKIAALVADVKDYDAIFKFDWLSATGTAIMIAAIITIIYLKMKPREAVKTFAETINELKTPIYSIGMVLAFAFIANYSGMSATLALALSHTGNAFTFFSPFLGWIGVFLTGSDTSAKLVAACKPQPTANCDHKFGWCCNTSGKQANDSRNLLQLLCAVGLVGKESDLFALP